MVNEPSVFELLKFNCTCDLTILTVNIFPKFLYTISVPLFVVWFREKLGNLKGGKPALIVPVIVSLSML